MAGLDPGIHHLKKLFAKRMDGRVKPGHDDESEVRAAGRRSLR
jgi:hypothetical protein